MQQTQPKNQTSHTNMTQSFSFTAPAILVLILSLVSSSFCGIVDRRGVSIPESDIDLVEFPLNLEYLEAEFFLFGSLGKGLDFVAPNLTQGGPSPVGAKKANLNPFINDVILQFAYQEVGHLR